MLYPIELRARTYRGRAAGHVGRRPPLISGGEERIRTSGSVLPDQPLSRRLPSATRPPLRAVVGGVSRIRTHGALRLSGFQDRRLKPLGHPSARTPSVTGRGNLAGHGGGCK